MAPKKITIVGSGNWGSAIACIVGQNAAKLEQFDTKVNMWVFEEQVEGRNLTEIINTEHENVKYLPGIKLPENIYAEPDLKTACDGASILVFVLPHQFLGRIIPQIKDVVASDAAAVSLIKGHFELKDGSLELGSSFIRDALNIPTAVLMGANVANEVAKGEFAEATLGCEDPEIAKMLQPAFHAPSFRVNVCHDVPTVELCGGLKNVIALGAGFCDGIDLGNNTKAAILRIGIDEMFRWIQIFFPNAKKDTLFESCGLADLITTSYGGRNRKCAEAFARRGGGKDLWAELEKELLNGQKLQGTLACEEAVPLLRQKNLQGQFPLMETIYKIAFEGMDVKKIVELPEQI